MTLSIFNCSNRQLFSHLSRHQELRSVVFQVGTKPKQSAWQQPCCKTPKWQWHKQPRGSPEPHPSHSNQGQEVRWSYSSSPDNSTSFLLRSDLVCVQPHECLGNGRKKWEGTGGGKKREMGILFGAYMFQELCSNLSSHVIK